MVKNLSMNIHVRISLWVGSSAQAKTCTVALHDNLHLSLYFEEMKILQYVTMGFNFLCKNRMINLLKKGIVIPFFNKLSIHFIHKILNPISLKKQVSSGTGEIFMPRVSQMQMLNGLNKQFIVDKQFVTIVWKPPKLQERNFFM